MDIAGKFSRRKLAKGLVASGMAAALSVAVGSDALTETSENSETSPMENAWQDMHWKVVFPGVWKATFARPETFTPVSHRLIPADASAFVQLPSVTDMPLDGVQGRTTQRGCSLRLPLRPNEDVYGFGLQFMSLSQRGKKKIVRVNADPKVDSGDSNAPVPFYVTTMGVGILVDTARYATFYVGDARPKPQQPLSSAPLGNADPNYTHSLEEHAQGHIIVEIPQAPGVDLYLFAGPTMLEAVKRYNIFSGGGFVPPEWGLGFWYRADSHATQENVLQFAKEFRSSSIPCDVIGLEPGWQSHAYSCTFAWDKERFPEPGAFVKDMADQQYKVNLWEHAFTNPASPLFTPLLQYSGNYGVWGGLVPDFASNDARTIFGDYHGQTLIDAGISGFKLDECDNSDFTGGWSFPELSSFPSGLDGEQMHSVFGLQYQHALFEQYRKRGKSTYGLVRSSGALATPYPFVLYSDLYDHRQFVRALVNSGFSGLLWCPEVRDAASVEDLIRRLQSVIFSPLAMINGWYIKNPPWKQIDRKKNNAGELMDQWQQVEERCRQIIGWRMQLVPFLTAAFQRYASDGTPPFRALVLDFPEAKNLRTVDDEYMVGDRMLVAPLFAGEPNRRVVLPEGVWHNFWTGVAVKGGTEFSVPSSTENIPVFVKSGSIIPWAQVGQHAGDPATRRLEVRVYGDGSIPFKLDGKQNTLQLRWANGKGSASGEAPQNHGYVVNGWQKIG